MNKLKILSIVGVALLISILAAMDATKIKLHVQVMEIGPTMMKCVDTYPIGDPIFYYRPVQAGVKEYEWVYISVYGPISLFIIRTLLTILGIMLLAFYIEGQHPDLWLFKPFKE